MGRAPCCEKVGLKKGPWTPEEDQKLLDYIKEHGHGSWRSLPLKAGLLRCGKSCRLRWTNYLRPDIKRGKFSSSEEQTIIQLHALLGNRWSAIASYLPQRTDNEVKNYWNTHLKKRLMRKDIHPNININIFNNIKNGININNHIDIHSILSISKNKSESESLFWSLSHEAQWECARQEAEARLVSRECHVVASDWSLLKCAKICPKSGQFGSILAETQIKSGDGDLCEDFLSSQPIIANDKLPSLPAISSNPSSPSDGNEGGGFCLPAISSSCCSSFHSPTSPALDEADKDEWASILQHLMDTPLSPASSLHLIGSQDKEEEDEEEQGHPLFTFH